jgi:hypothetical protein
MREVSIASLNTSFCTPPKFNSNQEQNDSLLLFLISRKCQSIHTNPFFWTA